MASSGDIFDGYRLIRPIGRGGFGEVWLCRVEATGELRALKLLPASDPAQLERELGALIRYRSVASELQCPNLLPIEHVNRTGDGLFYTMPLADGTSESAAEDTTWQPWTLAAWIENRKETPAWFSSEEIRTIIVPLVNAVQRLSDAGVVHRDIKPENILFIGGRPCLGDISLLTDDAASITRRGTPGYAAPSWYLETGGNPDMWGLATTLYSLVTGNSPDKLGRAAFLWPPQGETSVDQETGNHFHRVIFRAANEVASERYLRFEDFASSLACPQTSTPTHSAVPSAKRIRPVIYAFCVLSIVVGGWFFWVKNHSGSTLSTTPYNRTASPAVSSEFEAALTSASNDFEKLFAETNKKMLGNSGRTPNMDRFGALVQKIKEAGSLGQIAQALNDVDQLVPSIRTELFVPSNKELSEAVKELDSIACRPLALAKNAEEGFRADRFTNPLRNRVYSFQDQVGQIIAFHLTKRQDLASSLEVSVTEQSSRLKVERLDVGAYAEWSSTYKLCKRIESKLTEN